MRADKRQRLLMCLSSFLVWGRKKPSEVSGCSDSELKQLRQRHPWEKPKNPACHALTREKTDNLETGGTAGLPPDALLNHHDEGLRAAMEMGY